MKYPLHPEATVAAPKAYSSTRSQPMIHAKTSPNVAHPYVYADPATGIIDENSASHSPANTHPMAAKINDSTTAGPARRAVAAPVMTKIPAALIAPLPTDTRWVAPSARRTL